MSMKLYIAMINDRHSDPEPFPFTTPEAAIAYARQQADEGDNGHGVEEEDIDGWLYYARYSSEGDDVWVVEKTLAVPSGGPTGGTPND